jgi:AcrR family transcriptional regulator
VDGRDSHSARKAARQERLRPRREPLQARARARVEGILAATIDLLATHDVDEITTASIARRAKVPIGSVYHYFPSKEGVLAELVARTTSRVDAASTAALARELARLPWQQAIERTIDRSVLAYRSDAAFVAVWRATRGTQAFREAASASDERFAQLLETLPMVHGQVRPHTLRAAIRIANAFLDWVLDTPDARERGRVVREMKRALIAYLTPEFEEDQLPGAASAESR